jgi:hypothetical protein
MSKLIPVATARYNRYVTVEFDSGADAKEFFYQLNELMGYDPRNGQLGPGTGLDWALPQLSAKRASKLTRSTRRRAQT